MSRWFPWLLALWLALVAGIMLGESPKPNLQAHAPADILPDGPLPARLSEAVPLARITLEVLAIHDPNRGWGAAVRGDYRIDRRWALTVEQSRSVTEGGFSVRLGGVR